MRAAPRAESGSPPDPDAPAVARSRWPAARRLRSPAQFVAVTSDPRSIRVVRPWLALAGQIHLPSRDEPPVRFGFTASRRHARRAVDRNTVKRVLREASRQRLGDLDDAAGDCRVDVVIRLKSTVPDARIASRRAWKAALRAQADALLDELARRLRDGGGRR